MSKNQPRDGNGKFAKKPSFIALYGNNNAVALFETVEDMEKFAKENGMDIPKERNAKKEEKNPDCEPATKGYVKCLLRKTYDHKHHLDGSGLLLLASVAFGWMFTIVFGSVLVSPSSSFNVSITTAQQWFPPTFLFSLAVTVFLIEVALLEVEGRKKEMPTEILKYSPPVCEKKDDCS